MSTSLIARLSSLGAVSGSGTRSARMTITAACRLCRLSVAILGVTSASGASAQRSPMLRNALRAEIVGCYTLFTAPVGGVETQLYNASSVVRLDAQPIGYGTPGVVRAMIPLTPANIPRALRPRPYTPGWTADSLSDTVRLSFVDGFSGAIFVLRARPGRPDTLTGCRFEVFDVGVMNASPGPARAVRRPCPEPR